MRVGYKLYREVRDYAPGDWSASELVVAWVIADDANDHTRRSWIELPLLCFYTRLAASSVRAALAKLGAGGYEFRVAHGYDKLGRPVYATKGHSVDYLVPDMAKGASLLAPFVVDNSPEAARIPAAIGGYPQAKGARNSIEAARIPAAIGPKGARIPAPLPSTDLNHLTLPSFTNGPVVTGPVENTHATSGQQTIDQAAAAGDGPAASRRPGRHALPEQLAARQAAQSRAERENGAPAP